MSPRLIWFSFNLHYCEELTLLEAVYCIGLSNYLSILHLFVNQLEMI